MARRLNSQSDERLAATCNLLVDCHLANGYVVADAFAAFIYACTEGWFFAFCSLFNLL